MESNIWPLILNPYETIMNHLLEGACSSEPIGQPWSHNHPAVTEHGLYKEYISVLPELIFYLLQDGCGVFGGRIKPRVWAVRCLKKLLRLLSHGQNSLYEA